MVIGGYFYRSLIIRVPTPQPDGELDSLLGWLPPFLMSHDVIFSQKSPDMNATTHRTGSNGPAIHTGQRRNEGLVNTTEDNNSELLSVKPSNPSPLFSSSETSDTAPLIDKEER